MNRNTVQASDKQNLFFVASPLHLICAQILASTVYQGECNRLFFLKPDIESLLDSRYWASVDYLPWPRHYPLSGLFGRYRRIIENARIVEERARGARQIVLLMPVIDSEAYNYNISIGRKILQGRQPEVCLIPDGLLNIRRHEQGRLREFSKYFRKLRRLVTPALDYYLFKGDRTGSDDPLVKKIYVLPGFPNEYSPSKTIELNIVQMIQDGQRSTKNAQKALVLSQPLTAVGLISDDDHDKICTAIHNYLHHAGITEVDYKAHPRDKRNELFVDTYQPLEIDTPLEYYLFNNPYKVIIGINSTTLLLVKLLDKSCEAISFYPDLIKYKKAGELEENSRLFSRLGVEIKFYGDEGKP